MERSWTLMHACMHKKSATAVGVTPKNAYCAEKKNKSRKFVKINPHHIKVSLIVRSFNPAEPLKTL